jgi:protein-disulfide isomerase
VGGAERSARRRRQQHTAGGSAVAAARSGGDRNKVIIGVVVIVVLVGVVVAGVIYTTSRKNATEGEVIQPVVSAQAAAPDYPVRRDGAVAVVGRDSATVTLDVYADFLCPFCARFEQTYGKAIEEKVRAGELRVQYHMVPLLNNQSDPPGYSMDAANAGLCVADGGRFPAYLTTLYARQPAEGARGYDNGQLIRLGNDLGVTEPDFAACVESGRYDQQIEANYQRIQGLTYLHTEFPDGRKGFATPTVAVGQDKVDIDDPNWLNSLIDVS